MRRRRGAGAGRGLRGGAAAGGGGDPLRRTAGEERDVPPRDASALRRARPAPDPRRRGAPATPPDRSETWAAGDVLLRAEVWADLVLPEAAASAHACTAVAIHDPRHRAPLLLATPLALPPRAVRDGYADRWPVEHLPLAAKQVLGAARQFVSAPETCQRLPALALLAGAVLSYAAATTPPIPTGCWDRRPRPTPGRLRRLLAHTPFPHDFPLPARLRQKAAVATHLPKGFWGQRRRAATPPPRPLPPSLDDAT